MSLPPRHRCAYLVGPEQVEVREVPLAKPAPTEMVVRVGAATTCGTDLKVFLRGGHPRMLQVPCPFGHEISGTIAAVGSDVSWNVGESVIVINSASCGTCQFCLRGRENLCERLAYLNGAFAEYIHVPERFVRRSTYRRPEALAVDLAALAEPLACVIHGLDACPAADLEDVILFGAGPIGLMFVAALAAQGVRPTVVDRSSDRLRVARELGAGATFTALPESTEGRLVIEATGNPDVWLRAVTAVRPGGTAVLFGGCPGGTTVPLDTTRFHYHELTLKGVYHHTPATVRRAIEMLTVHPTRFRPLLSDSTDLDGVEDALRRMQRREVLKVVIRP